MADYNDALNRNNPSVQARTKAQNRANVLQLKLIGQSHPTGLTANLLKLFEPRPPLEYKPPPEKRKCPPYTGMAQFVSWFAEPTDPEYAPPVVEGEAPTQRRARIRKLRLEEGARKAAEELEKYDPSKDPNATGDPYKTLFVARLNYETTEHRIKREFETYGPIKRGSVVKLFNSSGTIIKFSANSIGMVVIHLAWGSCTPMKVRLVTDKETNKPRGYAFIEFVHTRDMKTAYKQADGKKLDNRRVLVDVERGRTVPNWRPRRLGGGLGTTRTGGEEVGQKHSTRDQQQLASGHSRSEEPRARDDRHLDREKSQDRGRDREREHERSRERARDPREDRHPHRDRERTREKEKDRDRERDRVRDRARGRDKERERERDRPRERDRERERNHDQAGYERDRGYFHDKDSEYGNESKRGRARSGTRERDPVRDHMQEWYEEPRNHEHERGYSQSQYQKHYDHPPPQNVTDSEILETNSYEYDKSQPDYYQNQYGYPNPDQREEGEAVGDDYGYHRSASGRSFSREREG